MIVAGIDPGQKGGIVLLSGSGQLLAQAVMPATPRGMIDVLGPAKFIYIEKAQAMPKQGSVSMFNYGRHFGELLGVIAALGIPHVLVPPRTWSKVMHAGTKAGDTKKRSLEAFTRLFPGIDPIPQGCRVPHIGIIEAALIAEYGRRQL